MPQNKVLTQSAAQTLTRRSAVAINQCGDKVLKLREVTAAVLFLWSDITLMIRPVSELMTEAKPLLSPDTNTWPEQGGLCQVYLLGNFMISRETVIPDK